MRRKSSLSTAWIVEGQERKFRWRCNPTRGALSQLEVFHWRRNVGIIGGMATSPHVQPLGDSAALIELGDEINQAVNRHVHSLASVLRAHPLEGVIEWLPTYVALTVFYDPLIRSYDEVARWLRECANKSADIFSTPENQPSYPPRTIEVPTHYGDEFGPDLTFVAQYHGLSQDEVIRIHSGVIYQVFMLGFTPGFPYLGELSEQIATPRLATPRPFVPMGSVGIAARQTGIYPIASPGGWRIIGRTTLKLFDPNRDPPFMIRAGDMVKFVPTR